MNKKSKKDGLTEHQRMVSTLVKPGKNIRIELTNSDAHLVHMVMGISGEAGELLDAVKKKTIYRKELDRENVVEELGDLEFYMEGLRQELTITREETLNANLKKLAKRYGEDLKYSDTNAVERADKVRSDFNIGAKVRILKCEMPGMENETGYVEYSSLGGYCVRTKTGTVWAEKVETI